MTATVDHSANGNPKVGRLDLKLQWVVTVADLEVLLQQTGSQGQDSGEDVIVVAGDGQAESNHIATTVASDKESLRLR